MKIKKGRGYTYGIEYHFAWTVIYRKGLLTGETKSRLAEIINAQAAARDVVITNLDIQADHVRISVDCTPQHTIPNLVKILKGVSALLLLREVPELKSQLEKGSLWNASYFVSTSLTELELHLPQYLEEQPRAPRKRGRPTQ